MHKQQKCSTLCHTFCKKLCKMGYLLCKLLDSKVMLRFSSERLGWYAHAWVLKSAGSTDTFSLTIYIRRPYSEESTGGIKTQNCVLVIHKPFLSSFIIDCTTDDILSPIFCGKIKVTSHTNLILNSPSIQE